MEPRITRVLTLLAFPNDAHKTTEGETDTICYTINILNIEITQIKKIKFEKRKNLNPI